LALCAGCSLLCAPACERGRNAETERERKREGKRKIWCLVLRRAVVYFAREMVREAETYRDRDAKRERERERARRGS